MEIHFNYFWHDGQRCWFIRSDLKTFCFVGVLFHFHNVPSINSKRQCLYSTSRFRGGGGGVLAICDSQYYNKKLLPEMWDEGKKGEKSQTKPRRTIRTLPCKKLLNVKHTKSSQLLNHGMFHLPTILVLNLLIPLHTFFQLSPFTTIIKNEVSWMKKMGNERNRLFHSRETTMNKKILS